MIKLSNLIQTVASVTDFPENSVKLAARTLREDGLITSTGRGFGGADMLPKDASNLLIGLMASTRLIDAPQAVTFSRLATPREKGVKRFKKNSNFDDKEDFWDDTANFGDALDRLIGGMNTVPGAKPPMGEFEITFKANREQFSAQNKIKYTTISKFEEVEYLYHIADDQSRDIQSKIRDNPKYKINDDISYTARIVPHGVLMILSALFHPGQYL